MMEWISVDERLPEVNTVIQVHHPTLGDGLGVLLTNGVWDIEAWGYAPAWRVTHWMPLPKPPTEENE
jgi:hypothetical protein